MKFDSYITSSTKTAFTVDVNQKLIKYNKFSLKKAAFTLAETLITLTPNLISSYQKHTYVVGLKKAYSQLQNAMKMIPITQGCPAGDYDCVGWNNWGKVTNIDGQEFNGELTKKMTYLLSKQFKINKLCYYGSTDESCEKLLNHLNDPGAMAAFITNDGIIYTVDTSCGIDINGFKGPNKWGRDQFKFEITGHYAENRYGIPQGTILPWGSKLHADVYGEGYYWRNNNYCTTENVNKGDWNAVYCAGRVLEEDAMNY